MIKQEYNLYDKKLNILIFHFDWILKTPRPHAVSVRQKWTHRLQTAFDECQPVDSLVKGVDWNNQVTLHTVHVPHAALLITGI